MFPRRHGLTFVVLFLLLPAFLWDTMRVSHRFAGPVLRLRRMMRELSLGEDPGELRFRDGDFWMELGDYFNDIRSRLHIARVERVFFNDRQPRTNRRFQGHRLKWSRAN